MNWPSERKPRIFKNMQVQRANCEGLQFIEDASIQLLPITTYFISSKFPPMILLIDSTPLAVCNTFCFFVVELSLSYHLQLHSPCRIFLTSPALESFPPLLCILHATASVMARTPAEHWDIDSWKALLQCYFNTRG